ncbi:Uncharacterised protein [Mycobacteroides abscessus subsp. abscessus]|nr:Uncharacterised protein [Mycobacteroides abscessus subsp. abscessus]SHW73999.1 Uncharacterised protein [Mycobacteroides abscessus subsp. abscessus]SHW74770.1 Uncharacterised protein [Mycobacteroides abscessus subsp. abscessus]SHX28986.1 Uncharacterised protein [Mycobacteroides abscessus subsp. abscessus]SHZ52515.1 Uncharacterised protein [Mycobacteroides abscessus subsp. abscessus]
MPEVDWRRAITPHSEQGAPLATPSTRSPVKPLPMREWLRLSLKCLAAQAKYARIYKTANGGSFCRYAIIGSIADRGTSTCNAPYESGSIAPWSKKNRIPSLSTAKFW